MYRYIVHMSSYCIQSDFIIQITYLSYIFELHLLIFSDFEQGVTDMVAIYTCTYVSKQDDHEIVATYITISYIIS